MYYLVQFLLGIDVAVVRTNHRFLRTLRILARCYQAFEQCSAQHIRQCGLTPPQFDVIATLGNTPGMRFRELGERTLITKGTLTGVVDRLVARGLVERCAHPEDRRSLLVRLTVDGEDCFNTVFPAHLAYMQPAFEVLGEDDFDAIDANLARLHDALVKRRGT